MTISSAKGVSNISLMGTAPKEFFHHLIDAHWISSRPAFRYSWRIWEGRQLLSARSGGLAPSRKYWLSDLSLCWQKRQQDSADQEDYDHISKVPVDAMNPGLHALNSHDKAMEDVPPSR
jgi:hypothetical protein